MAILGMSALLLATRWGLNLDDDATWYMSVARNVLSGNGLGVLDPDSGLHQTTRYPPLYPLLLALAGAISGGKLLAAARWLHVLMFGATVMLVCMTASKYNRSSSTAPVIAGLFVIFGASVLRWYGFALSEGAFLLSGAASLLLLARYAEQPRVWFLVASGMATGAAALTRYAGIPLVCTGVVVLLLSDIAGGKLHRLWSAGLFAVLGALPLALWLTSQVLASPPALPPSPVALASSATPVTVGLPASITDRELGLHLVTLHELAYGPLNVARWLVPEGFLRAIEAIVAHASVSGIAEKVILIVLGAGCVAAALLMLRAFGLRRPRLPTCEMGPAGTVLVTFGVFYLGFLLVTMSVAYPSTELSLRTLLPMYFAVVVVAPGLLRAKWRSLAGRPMRRLAVATLVALVFAGNLVQTGLWIVQSNEEGLGMATTWQQSPLVARAAGLPSADVIYTNNPDALRLYTNHVVGAFPQENEGSDEHVARLASIRTRLQEHTAVVVYFDQPPPTRFRYLSIEQLRQLIPLAVSDTESDGAVYTAG